ncbi:MAG: TIGR00366 family protein [Fusobacteriaceae bacterium]|jgi:uncharacterized ion transporter superfamily protein YfcC|nr:TIGR00366 family protein [Fusobacteriaceae bacterium]
MEMTGNKKKKEIKMPHLFWIMIGLLLVACLLTYIVPAGKFAVGADGKILGDQFSYIGKQSPVPPWRMFMMMLDGVVGSGSIIWVVLVAGAMTSVVMATGAIDEILNWSIYKLKDRSENILISIMFILMVYMGSFGGSDALIAVVPIGVIFTKKLKLDPICAIGVTSYATLIGFGTGPTKQFITQMMMGVPVYAAFFTMFISMNFYMILGLILLLRYVKKIRKDPRNSLMWSEGWDPDKLEVSAEDEEALKKGTKLSGRTIAILILYLGQYALMVAYSFIGGDPKKLLNFLMAINMFVAIACGFIGGFSFDRIGNEFIKGLKGIVFVGFVIGLARVMTQVMTEGQIIHTIVYVLTKPIMNLSRSISTVGMTAVISIINIMIPSASSKQAILIPIIRPITETLNMDKNLAVQAFQYGDGFTNIVSPFLGWTVGSCAMAGVPFPKWFKWALPKVILFILISFVIIFVLTEIGWKAF